MFIYRSFEYWPSDSIEVPGLPSLAASVEAGVSHRGMTASWRVAGFEKRTAVCVGV